MSIDYVILLAVIANSMNIHIYEKLYISFYQIPLPSKDNAFSKGIPFSNWANADVLCKVQYNTYKCEQ